MKYRIVAVGLALALGAAVPAHAVVLEQKWQAGQNTSYDVGLDGSVNVQAPADAPVIWAGVPLEISIKGDGNAQLQTVSVDPTGVGTVAFKLPLLQISFETFGQQGKWTLRNGASQLSLNGKPLDVGQGLNLTALNNPETALKIDKDGRVRGIESLKPLPAQDAAPAENAPAVSPEKAINQGALMTAMILQSLPALWPGRDVQPGETWQVNLDAPPALRPGGANAEGAPKSIGTFNMTLKGQEQEGGKTLWRVGVIGNIQVDVAQWSRSTPAPGANAPAATGPAQPVGGGMRLDLASQRVEGDILFDADAGQIARAELGLNSRLQGRTAKRGGGWSGASWADFAGTLQLDLRPTPKK